MSEGGINACTEIATKGHSALGQGWIGDPSAPGELEGIGTTIAPPLAAAGCTLGRDLQRRWKVCLQIDLKASVWPQ